MNLILAFFITLGSGFANPVPSPERVIRIDVPNHDAVYTLQHRIQLTITDAQDRYVMAYADDDKIAELRALGYPVTVVAGDYRALSDAPLGTYATYAEVCSTMRYLSVTYPMITKLETLGISVQGRPILIMKVTGNASVEADKPRIRLNGPHHGNEKIATEITLSLLKYLCENYAGNPGIQALVDTREIWIDPIFNVDGHVADARGNANGYDLNRDYGYEFDPWYGSPTAFSQVETRAMRNHSDRHSFSLEYSYHSAAAYVNYMWDNQVADPPDSGYIISLSQRYADSTYGSNTQLDPINGWDWYEVHGSCQDMAFGSYGALAWTIETSQPLSNRAIVDQICVANRRALLDMIKLAGWGIHGLVRDSLTGAPLWARIEFTNPSRWITYTQAGVGDFHKMVPAGTYALKVSANGYVSKTIGGIVVPDTGAANIDIALAQAAPDAPNYVQKIVWLRRNDDSHIYRDWYTRALGEPDASFYTAGPSPSVVVFDVDPGRPVRNLPGNDISVYATGNYTLAAANNWEGPWLPLGNGSGNASFDLTEGTLDSARYLKFATSNGTPTLDAISYVGGPETGVEQGPALVDFGRISVTPNPCGVQAGIRLSAPATVPIRLEITDISGRAVRNLTVPAQSARVSWDLRNQAREPVANGVYFCRVGNEPASLPVKVIVQR